MPWCETCHRFLSPSTVRENGTCPTCGRTVERGGAQSTVTEVSDHTDDRHPTLPWHLWLLAAAVAVYLGFRAWQGIEWVIQHI
jgi:PHP family Zn ribbon phosphoesterase